MWLQARCLSPLGATSLLGVVSVPVASSPHGAPVSVPKELLGATRLLGVVSVPVASSPHGAPVSVPKELRCLSPSCGCRPGVCPHWGQPACWVWCLSPLLAAHTELRCLSPRSSGVCPQQGLFGQDQFVLLGPPQSIQAAAVLDPDFVATPDQRRK
jgi:hypothetical protein